MTASPLRAVPRGGCIGTPGGTPAKPDATLMALARSPAIKFLDDLMPSSPSDVLRAAAMGQLDRAALGAACVYRDYLGAVALVAGAATPILLLLGGVPGVLSGIMTGIASAGYPIFDAICKQMPPSPAAVATATRGMAQGMNAAQAGGVDLGNVDPDTVATLGETYSELAKANGKRLPTSAPSTKAHLATMSTSERAAYEAQKRKRIAIAKAKAAARIRVRQKIAAAKRPGKLDRPTYDRRAPTRPGSSTPTKQGGAIPWLIAAGIAAKVLL